MFCAGIVYDNGNELAWLWLASVTEPLEEKIAHFHRVLEINPENETARDTIRSTREKMLQTAFENAENAVNQGDDERAEMYLDEVFELDPQHEDSWFLKARLAVSFEEKMACFEKMLEFDAENERVRQAVQNTKNERAREFFEKADDSANDGDRQQANEFLAEVFRQNPHHEEAWILKSRMTDSFEEKIVCFERILEFNPANETAQAGVNLRSMLNNNAPKMEEAVTFPHEEIVEQSFADETQEEISGEAQEFEEQRKFEDIQQLEDTQELDEAQLAAVEADFVESFEDGTISSIDETQEFTYFAEEITEDEQVELLKTESFEEAAEVEEIQSETVSEEINSEASPPEADENLSYREPSENLTGENNQKTDHHETEQPPEVFADYSEDYAEEDFAGDSKNDSDFFAVSSDDICALSGINENDFHAGTRDETASETEMPEAQDFVEENDAPAVEVSRTTDKAK